MLKKIITILFIAVLITINVNAQIKRTVVENLSWLNFMFKNKVGKIYNMRVENEHLVWDDNGTVKVPLIDLVIQVNEDKERLYLNCIADNCIILPSGRKENSYQFKLKHMKVGNSNQTYFMGKNLVDIKNMALGERPEEGEQQKITSAEMQQKPIAELIQQELDLLNKKLMLAGANEETIILSSSNLIVRSRKGQNELRIPLNEVTAVISKDEKDVKLNCKIGEKCIEDWWVGNPTTKKIESGNLYYNYSEIKTIPESYVIARTLNRLIRLQIAANNGLKSTSLAEMEKQYLKEDNLIALQQIATEKIKNAMTILYKVNNMLKTAFDPLIAVANRKEQIVILSKLIKEAEENFQIAYKTVQQMENIAISKNNIKKAHEAKFAVTSLFRVLYWCNFLKPNFYDSNKIETYDKEELHRMRISSNENLVKISQDASSANFSLSGERIKNSMQAENKPKLQFGSAEEIRNAVDLDEARLNLIGINMQIMKQSIENTLIINTLKAYPDKDKMIVSMENIRKTVQQRNYIADTSAMHINKAIKAAENLKSTEWVNIFKKVQDKLKLQKQNLNTILTLLPKKEGLMVMDASSLLVLFNKIKEPLDQSERLAFEMIDMIPKTTYQVTPASKN